MKKFLASIISNTVFANMIMIMVIISGFITTKFMIRENFPEFSLDMISIYVSYPGADPEEVEEGISIKIEEAINNIDGIKNYSTSSTEGLCVVNIEIRKGYNIYNVIDNVRTKVNSISSFPTSAKNPIIKELILQDPVILLYISGNISEKVIKKLSLEIKDEIQRLPEVSQIKIVADKKYEISVEIPEKNLIEYGLSLNEIAASISKNNLNLHAGTIDDKHQEIRIKTIGRKYTVEELNSILVIAKPDGKYVPLSRLASTIKDGFTEDSIEANVNGQLSSLFIVYKTNGEDSLSISNAVSNYIIEKQLSLPENINLNIVYDNTEMLKSRIDLLLKNGILGLIIVFLSLSLFLNISLSFWVGIGIFVSVSGALTVVYLLGGTLNMVSLFSLIMVLGIVVDDAIVIGEAIYFNKKQEQSSLNAAINGVYEVGVPVLTAVFTTIIAFLPLFYIKGIMGKFISILPLVVIICLLISLIESLFILPAHLSYSPVLTDSSLTKNSVAQKIISVQKFFTNKMHCFINNTYIPFLTKILNWRYVSVSIAIALFFISVGLVNGGILKFEVFPSVDSFVMTSTVEFPNGTSFKTTKSAIEQIDKALVALAEKTETKSGDFLIKSRVSITGETLEEPFPRRGSNLGSVQVNLLESEKRKIHSDELITLWEKEIGDIPGVKSLKINGLHSGPPGAPIEVWIQGKNFDILLKAANDLITRLKEIDGLRQISSDFSFGKNEVCLELTPEGRCLGLNLIDLAEQVNFAYYGAEALRIQRNKDDIKIKVCYSKNERRNISNIYNMNIKTPEGHYVKLKSIANIFFKQTNSTIMRTNGMRRISVSAGIDTRKANTNEILTELNHNYFTYLLEKYPGISISVQGEEKKMRDSFSSLAVGFPLAIVAIFMVVAISFRSYLQPMVVMAIIPFGIIGSVIGHLLLGYNISIMSIFGIVALTGIVVNDAIVLVERVNTNLSSKMPFFESVVNAGSRRFMAVFLTTISTVGGLSPLLFETDMQAKFLIPMAISIASGVVFASILTLIFIPSFLVILSDIRLIINKVRVGKWEKRELLEPARNRIVSHT